jgi:hypothetical protein
MSKLKTQKKRGFISKIWLTITDPQASGIFGGLLFLLLVGVLFVSVSSGFGFALGCALIAGVLATATYVIRVGLSTLHMFEFRILQAKAQAWARSADTEEDQSNRFGSIHAFGAGAALIAAGIAWDSPMFNDDDSPMMGVIDINGNPDGFISPMFNDDDSPMMGGIDIHGNPDGFISPMFNVDGTLMMGGIDIHGNPFGVTSDHDYMGGMSSTSMDLGGGMYTWDHSSSSSDMFNS